MAGSWGLEGSQWSASNPSNTSLVDSTLGRPDGKTGFDQSQPEAPRLGFLSIKVYSLRRGPGARQGPSEYSRQMLRDVDCAHPRVVGLSRRSQAALRQRDARGDG